MMNFEVKLDEVEVEVEVSLAARARMGAEHLPTSDPAKLRVMLDPAGHRSCLWSE